MSTRATKRTVGSAAAIAGVAAVLAAAGVAPGDSRGAADAKITGAGVGKVKLGKTHQELRAAGLVGRIGPGCEFGGPNTRSARLRAPLKGSVSYSLKAPRRVRDITVTGGAKARGVGIGATIAQIKAAFPKARVDRATEDVFGVTLVRIPRDGGGRFHFAVDVDTDKTTIIGVPRIAFCE
jgi:hypothetical protein